MHYPNTDENDHFRLFASNLQRAIERYGDMPKKDWNRIQKRQVETLVRKENEFRRALIKNRLGRHVYEKFIVYIRDHSRSILSARPFFRERQTVFTAEISEALKQRNPTALYKFHFNYQFIRFVMAQYKWERCGSDLVRLNEEIKRLRTELVELNMPLAISRARIFYSSTPKAQLTYMDLIQISAEGLMAGIDKFVLPYTTTFRNVLIGRMVGNFIENYSETLIHFFPIEKRKIYRYNKVAAKYGENPDFEKIAEEVNQGVEPAHRTNSSEIALLASAASTVSSDGLLTPEADSSQSEETMHVSLQAAFAADESTHPDVRFEEAEAMSVMARAIGTLSPFEQKLLKLKGVTL